MREVYELKAAFAAKAQETLGKDDLVSRQSIYTRTAASLGMKGDATYLIIDGSDAALRQAETLLSGMAAKAKDKNAVLQKFDEIESASAQGMGLIG